MDISREVLLNNPFPTILGQDTAKSQLTSALLSGRHVMIMGSPGVGKTTLAKDVASLLPGKNFVRVQGSPDLTVEDLLGDIDPLKALEFGPLSKEAFTPGKIFKADKGVLFFDELNRAPEKLQNALLQVLQEGYATLGSYDVDFPTNFIFIATMNPEDITTEKVNDVLLDRFDVVYMGYPNTKEVETEIVITHGKKMLDVPDKLLSVMVGFVRSLRDDTRLSKTPSVRATLGLYERSQAHASLEGKEHVFIEDIVAVVVSVLAHRIQLKPSVKYAQSPTDVLKQAFDDFLEEMGYKKGDYP